MNLVVIGAGGFIGKRLCASLLAGGAVASLTLIARTAASMEAMSAYPDYVQRIICPTFDLLPDHLFRPDNIFVDLTTSFGPRSYPKFSISAAEENLNSRFHFYRRIIELPDAHLIYASSGGTIYKAEGSPCKTEDMAVQANSVYSFCKLSDENLISSLFRDKAAYTILRLSNPYGPGQVFKNLQGVAPVLLNCLKHNTPFNIIGSPYDIRDYIYIDDLIEAMATIIRTRRMHSNCTYNVASGVACRLIDFIETLMSVTQRSIKIENPGTTTQGGYYLSIDKITQATGWQPRIDLRQGLETWLSYEFPQLLGNRLQTL